PKPMSVGFAVGGYYTLRGRQSWGMVRCHSYRNRPGQADLLHLDLWWRGVNVLRDSGTFAYYDPPLHWGRYFISTAAHNTVVVGGTDQMKKGSRFRWYTLPRTKVLCHRAEETAAMAYWQGEHYGYRRLPSRAVHRRGVARVGEAVWAIVDEVIGTGEEDVELWWQLADGALSLSEETTRLLTPEGEVCLTVLSESPSVRRLWHGHDEDGLRAGWQSLTYGVRRPGNAMSASMRSPLPVRWVTLVILGHRVETKPDWVGGHIDWQLDDGSTGAIRLSKPGGRQMVRNIVCGTRTWDIAREGVDVPAIRHTDPAASQRKGLDHE
ncbi:MAG: heparinase II/III-family protein, partial [Planctomycetota bacterium]